MDKTDKPTVKRTPKAVAKVEVPERDEAAEAFDELRSTVERFARDTASEMNVLRRSVEVAVDRFEKVPQPVDSGPDMEMLIKETASVANRLAKFEQLPMLVIPPGEFAKMMGTQVLHAMNKGTEAVVAKLAQADSEHRQIRIDLQAAVKGARERRKQDRISTTLFGAGLVIGLVLCFAAARMSGEGGSGLVTAFFMGKDPWQAGQTMMQTANPGAWQKLASARDVIGNNGDTIQKCQAAAAKTGKDQKCLVTVRPPDP